MINAPGWLNGRTDEQWIGELMEEKTDGRDVALLIRD